MLPCFYKKQLPKLQLFSFENYFLLINNKAEQNDEFSPFASAQLMLEKYLKKQLTLFRNAPFLGHKNHWQEQ